MISAVNDDEFQIIKNACMAQADKLLCSLLHSASNSHCLFRILAENKLYCNWIRINFLNQARAGLRLARAWFLEIAFVREVSMCVCVCVDVCVSAPEAMNN